MCLRDGILLGASLLATALTGCAPAGSPPTRLVHLAGPPHTIDLSPYQSRPSPQPRVYARHDRKHPDTVPADYVRMISEARQIEGSLVGRVAQSVGRYLSPPEGGGAADRFPWPQSGPGGAAFFLQLTPPLPQYPVVIDAHQPIELRADVRLYDYQGRRRLGGTLQRTVTFQGYETLEADANTLPDCMRLQIVTRLRFFWGPRVDVTESVWLAPGIGEVRRIERLRGWAWLFPFDEVRQYDLISAGAVKAQLAAHSAEPARRWSVIAVHLDRCLPHPRLGGLAVEFARSAADAPAPIATGQSADKPIGG
ncbi:MAG: hypothetical protein JSV19_08630 [Phycisphaerales bacterium]|nr:MAG: hypothetical protein JSV19_08630 [Phycisphaerales bacterium]